MNNRGLDYYEKHAESYFETTVSADMENLYAPFLSLVKPGGRILDLGCGSGRDSKNFIQKGYEVEAVDSSPTLCRLASDYIGQEVICQDMKEIEYRGEFDGIWACASLVHMTKKEIHKMLEKLICALRKTGVLYMSVKYGQGEEVKSGRFFSFYDELEVREIFVQLEGTEVVSLFQTEDMRAGHQKEIWLNIIVKSNRI